MIKNKQRFAVILLIILLVSISIGYAILQSNLEITGTTSIDNAKWDIHWENVRVTEGSVSGSKVTTAATIDSSKTTVNYNIQLDKPGEFYEFTVEAVNAGTINGMISSIESKLNGATITTLPSYLQYYVRYSDGITIKNNQLLSAGERETYIVRIEFKKDVDASQLPKTEQTLNLSFSVGYSQANENAVGVRSYLYRSNENVASIGGPSSNLGTTYTTYASMNSATSKNVFLRHKVKNSLVDESEVGFIYEGNEYYLAGGVNEAAEETHPLFEANSSVITSLGGSCNTSRCTLNKSGVITAYATLQGQVYAFNNTWRCDITADGSSSCSPRG